MNAYAATFPALVRGLGTTFLVAMSAMLLAVALGFVLGVVRSQASRLLDWPVLAVVEFLRGIPLLVLMYVIFFTLPQAGITLAVAGRGNVTAAVVALALYAGALASEIVRGAIVSIPLGQVEAAQALGLARGTVLASVVLPQALRRMLPPFVGLFALIVESSSLSSLIGVEDLLEVARRHVESSSEIALPVYLTVLVAYFAINFPISLASQRLERRLA